MPPTTLNSEEPHFPSFSEGLSLRPITSWKEAMK